jgi:ubiquitin-protein ligase
MQTNKRLLNEIKRLYAQQNKLNLLDNDYLIYLNDFNLNKVHTIIKPPKESVYRHKFIRLDFDIPDDYPHTPPVVTFVNYDGVRIHPNMYEDGKCCSTILNTWPSDNEKWTSSMGIETVLLTFMSFLDNNPYTFEPGGRDDHTYTDYVLHQSWKTCLFRYLFDTTQPEIFTDYIHSYLLENDDDIFDDLFRLELYYPTGYYETRCFEIDLFFIDYTTIIHQIERIFRYIKSKEILVNPVELGEYINLTFKCDICFDTENSLNYEDRLECKHHFHKECLENHIRNNGNICPMCRRDVRIIENNSSKRQLDDEYIINPETKRRIKVGGKVYNLLKNKNSI